MKPTPKRLTIPLGRYCFQPRWSLTLLTLVFLLFFLKLGLWQLERADEKGILTAQFESSFGAERAALNNLPADTDLWPYLPVVATGSYDNNHNILLDNKIYEHQLGYEVLTPMQIIGDDRIILVNRGWIPAPRERHIFPDIPDVSDEFTTTGVIYIPPKPFTLERAGNTEAPSWPYRAQSLDIPKLQEKFDTPLFPFVLRLDANQPNGFVRDWQPVNMSAHKHFGYAFQWFTFALVLIIIFISLNIKKRQINK